MAVLPLRVAGALQPVPRRGVLSMEVRGAQNIHSLRD